MTGKGIIQGNRINLDEPAPFADGTRVTVEISPEGSPAKGSPSAILRLAGTLSAQEADEILSVVNQCRRIDRKLWDTER